MALGGLIIYKYIFGSCPTIYSPQQSGKILEAECFSYSISPRYESRDIDRIHYPCIVDNQLKLLVANEAAETHYINRMNILQVTHPKGLRVFPGSDSDIISVGAPAEIFSAITRNHKSIENIIGEKDASIWRSDNNILQRSTEEITRDWIDLTIPNPDHKDELVITLRLRNTLLNTVLLYDMMLASKGLEAIDWLGDDSQNLFYAWRLHNWINYHFGMDIEVLSEDEYQKEAHISDTGPIAWHDCAVKISVPEEDTVKIRLSSTPDNWFIDWIGASFDIYNDFEVDELDCGQLTVIGNSDPNRIKEEVLNKDDDQYLITYPANLFEVSYQTKAIPENMEQSFFLQSKGYYIEWIRGEWIAKASEKKDNLPFNLDDQTLIRTSALWSDKKTDFEQLFFEMKIPLKQELSND